MSADLGRWIRRSAIPPAAGASGDILRWVWRRTYSNVLNGKMCIGAITMSIPSMVSAMTIPTLATTMTTTSMTIDIEDCP